MDRRNRDNNKNNRIKKILIISACVLVVAAVAAGIILIRTPKSDVQTAGPAGPTDVAQTKMLKGVTIGGIDVSGKSKEEALSATSKMAGELLSNVAILLSIDGQSYQFTAKDLSLTTNLDDVIAQAVAYGNTGTDEERQQAKDTAKKDGKDFPVNIVADRETIAAVLQPIKEQVDVEAVDATAEFTPWGHTADGKAYEQDQQVMIEAVANGKTWNRPELVKISSDQMPNKFRYEYWQTSKYVKNYIPADAGISRFVYKEGKEGKAIDMDAVADSIISQLESGEYSTITAQSQTTQPKVTLEQIKKQTRLVSSWTSSYASHYGYNRNWNVAKLSGIVNGVVINPGEEWSINKQAGNRTVSGGWLEAAGIENGGYTQQAGGGVCQISSTTYNAAIRAALDITDSTHHSIISNYIPLGLDATISSPSPDLKIKNPYDTPIYIVSYVNPKDKNVTVEIYGPTVVDSQYGDVILDFTSEDLGTYGSPIMTYIYNTTTAPDDTAILPGASYKYADARVGQKVQTYKRTLSLEGKELKVEKFKAYDWKPINGKTYVNGQDPAKATPTPPTKAPTQTPTPPTPTPTAPTPTAPTPTPTA